MMRRRFHIIGAIGLLLTFCTLSGQSYQTQVLDNKIKTLQIYRWDNPLLRPIYALGSEYGVLFSFDELADGHTAFGYRIFHCDAEWKPSRISSAEYIEGVAELPIESYEFSSATYTHYCHYTFAIPNEEMTPKYSGNYVVEVYRQDDPRTVVARACFMVVEPMANVAMTATTITDISLNKDYQQVSLAVSYPDLEIPFPQSELWVSVMQNWRWDTQVSQLTPYTLGQTNVTYQHDRSLIFEAGNEFRRFESMSSRYNGMNVEHQEYHAPYQHVILYPDIVRANLPYSYDQDQNGRYVIRTSEGDENTQADYPLVHFSIPMDAPLLTGSIYVVGDLDEWIMDASTRMDYNFERKSYEKVMLLKHGLYNYQYLFVGKGDRRGSTAPIEGNKYETENEYQAFVYYRPMGASYDRLIGHQNISYKP